MWFMENRHNFLLCIWSLQHFYLLFISPDEPNIQICQVIKTFLPFMADISVSIVSSVAVSVLRVVCGETWHPDPTDRGQNNSCQQHSLHNTIQASADGPCAGKWWPGNMRKCWVLFLDWTEFFFSESRCFQTEMNTNLQ